MIIIGVDFHPEFQQIAWVDTDTGEFQEKRLAHRDEAEDFYRALAGHKVRLGMEASGHDMTLLSEHPSREGCESSRSKLMSSLPTKGTRGLLSKSREERQPDDLRSVPRRRRQIV
jgi:hypothetical protein